MTKVELLKMKEEKEVLRQRAEIAYQQLTGQISLIDDLIRQKEEEEKKSKPE